MPRHSVDRSSWRIPIEMFSYTPSFVHFFYSFKTISFGCKKNNRLKRFNCFNFKSILIVDPYLNFVNIIRITLLPLELRGTTVIQIFQRHESLDLVLCLAAVQCVLVKINNTFQCVGHTHTANLQKKRGEGRGQVQTCLHMSDP